MKSAFKFLKNEIVFVVATLCAIITCFIVPPNMGYIAYIDFSVIALLMTLMLVVAGFSRLHIFDIIARGLIGLSKESLFRLSIVLWGMCFVSAMVITNDVALITFVPLCIGVLTLCGRQSYIIYNVVLQTVAANLGSMLTPMGNPQNLYIYRYFNIFLGDFLKITFPLIIISAVLLVIATLPMLGKKVLCDITEYNEKYALNKKLVIMYCIMGVLSLLAVCKVINYAVVWFLVCVGCAFFDRAVFKKVDYILLLTFIMFFVFVGNIGSIEAVSTAMQSLIEGRVLEIAILFSQFISNVPAAVMLSSFTEDYQMLIKGVNIGGLGTLIASMASLISFRIYSQYQGSNKLKYGLIFSGVNIIFLLLLYVSCIIM